LSVLINQTNNKMEINFLSVILAAMVPMIMGFVWYHDKVFGNTWRNELGLTTEYLQKGNMAILFGLAFVMSLLMAMGQTSIAIHDSFIHGALYYVTNKTMIPEPGSEAAKWLDYYTTTLASTNHRFSHGATHGFLIAGIFVAVPVLVTDALFERRSFKFIMIKIGFWLISLSLMGGIIASMAK